MGGGGGDCSIDSQKLMKTFLIEHFRAFLEKVFLREQIEGGINIFISTMTF